MSGLNEGRWGLVGLLVGGWMWAGLACGSPAAADCRSDDECGAGEVCLGGGGLLVATGGRCVDRSQLDAGRRDVPDAGDSGPVDTCANADTCGPPSCEDGVENGGETDIDCGGPVCEPCDQPGEGCESDGDCGEGLYCGGSGADSQTCRRTRCQNGQVDPGETDVDCGGECPPCQAEEACKVDDDCRSRRCENGACVAGTCDDGVVNQDETDVDCGGSCEGCENGEGCETGGDCRSMRCGDGGSCVAPGCDDGIVNGAETDVDCGGPDCEPCDISESCSRDRDCQTESCEGSICRASCDDGLQNSGETDIDCGGPHCEACQAGKTCTGSSDCASGWCNQGTCTVRIAGKLTGGDPGHWSNGTYAESCAAYENPADPNYERKYGDVDLSRPELDRNGIYEIKPPGASEAYPVYCQMLRYNARGGWTLVVVSADDGQANWTWNRRQLLTTRDTSTFGSSVDRTRDLKSPAYHDLAFEDLLFVYRNAGGTEKWLAYDGVGDGTISVAAFTENKGATCYGEPGGDYIKPGFEKAAGNVQAGANLCSTDLYFNARDQDATALCQFNESLESAFGPTWSVKNDDGCPMDDPGLVSSFGPAKEPENQDRETDGRGFGKGLGIATDNDRIEMYVR